MPTLPCIALAGFAVALCTAHAVAADSQPMPTTGHSLEHPLGQQPVRVTAQNASIQPVNTNPASNNQVCETSVSKQPKAQQATHDNTQPYMPQHGNGAHDFDFLVGDWLVENKRLKHRFVGSNDWEHFTARQTNQPLPAGIGNFDDFVAPDWRPDFVGMSLRVFNPATTLWSIYWLDNHTGGLNAQGQLNPPVVGKFTGNTGIFTGDDVIGGRPVRVRFTWQKINANQAHWEQAMSTDQGRSWEINWKMTLTRVAQPVTDN